MGDFFSLEKLSHTGELQTVHIEKGAGGRNAWDRVGQDRVRQDGMGWDGIVRILAGS